MTDNSSLIGTSIADLSFALNAMEASLPVGGKAALELYTETLPMEGDLAQFYINLAALGFHTSYPQARVAEGVPVTTLILKKGSPQWVELIAVLPTLFIIGLIAFGITQLSKITSALMPILITVFVGGAVIIGLLSRPAERVATAYIEKGKVPLLPSTIPKEEQIKPAPKTKYVRFISGPHVGTTVSVESWERERADIIKRGEPPPEVEYLPETEQPSYDLPLAERLQSEVMKELQHPFGGLLDPGRFPKRDEALKKLGEYSIVDVHDDGDLTVRAGKLYVVTTDGEVFAHYTSQEALKRITTHPATSSNERILPFAGFKDSELTWVGIFPDKTLSVSVKDFYGKPKTIIENAFRRSRAIISNIITNHELPIGAISKGEIWWLATIRDMPVEVHVTDIDIFSEKELEDIFNSSVAMIKEGELELLAKTEGDPLRKFCCRQCGECAPAELLGEGKFPERIQWLRHHYKERHPGMWGHMPAVIPSERSPKREDGQLEYMADSPQYLAQTINNTGWREKIDEAFQEAIARTHR